MGCALFSFVLILDLCVQGTPEVGGMTTQEALRLVRGLAGADVVGGDLVEVAPAYDPTTKYVTLQHQHHQHQHQNQHQQCSITSILCGVV